MTYEVLTEVCKISITGKEGIRHLSFSELNAVESTEFIGLVEDYFLLIFFFKTNKIVFYKFYRF